MSIYKQAAMSDLRFRSKRGLLSVSDLFNLPLASKTRDNLNDIAVAVHNDIQATPTVSFVDLSAGADSKDQLRLEILKDVIATRQVHNQQTREAAGRNAARDKLQNILADKEDEALRNLTPEELKQRLAEL